MAYRNVMITTPCRISCQREQVIIQGETNVSFPLEDLLSLLIESRQCTVTTAALSALAKNGTTVFLCDEKHILWGYSLAGAASQQYIKCLESGR